MARLAKLLSIPVTLVSEPDKGAMFAVDLPRVRHVDVEAVARAASTSRPRDDLAGTIVVVVDDEATILDTMRTLLEIWGCSVVTGASGSEALQRLGTSPRVPDILVCDYRLRGNEDGIGVIEALRAEFNEDIPAVLITGDTGPERIRAIEASGLMVLHKPLQEDKLRACLSMLATSTPASGLQDAEAPGH